MVVSPEKSKIEFFSTIIKDNYFKVYIFVKEIFHLIGNRRDFGVIMIKISFIKELKIEFSLIIIKCNRFKERIFVEELFKILGFKMKVNLIVKFSKLMNIFPHLISRAFFTIVK